MVISDPITKPQMAWVGRVKYAEQSEKNPTRFLELQLNSKKDALTFEDIFNLEDEELLKSLDNLIENVKGL